MPQSRWLRGLDGAVPVSARPYREENVNAKRNARRASRGFPPITVQCKVASLVAYENVYLDKVTSRVSIRLASTQAEERVARESEDAFLLRRSKRVRANMCELDGQCGAKA